MRRHRDRVRRESKLTSRMRRTDSASYTTSPPPMALNDVSNAIPLPIYSTAPQVSLLAEPSQALHNQQYLSSYNAALQEASHTSQMFTSSPYQSMWVVPDQRVTEASWANGICSQTINVQHANGLPGYLFCIRGLQVCYELVSHFRDWQVISDTSSIALVPLYQSHKTPASYTPCQRFSLFLIQIIARKAATLELFRAGQNLDVGSMGAMADSSPPLAIFFDISGRNQAKQPKLHAQIVVLSLLEQPPEMDTCCTTSVSREEATAAATETATLHPVPIHDW